jgi:predicted nucleic acid-binding protein
VAGYPGLGPAPHGEFRGLAAPGRPAPYDEAVAVKWGEIQGNAHLRGRPRPVNDSWIAACCLAHNLPLATFNAKDFADYANHDGLHLIRTEPQ